MKPTLEQKLSIELENKINKFYSVKWKKLKKEQQKYIDKYNSSKSPSNKAKNFKIIMDYEQKLDIEHNITIKIYEKHWREMTCQRNKKVEEQ